jgi:hypothetical protein
LKKLKVEVAFLQISRDFFHYRTVHLSTVFNLKHKLNGSRKVKISFETFLPVLIASEVSQFSFEARHFRRCWYIRIEASRKAAMTFSAVVLTEVVDFLQSEVGIPIKEDKKQSISNRSDTRSMLIFRKFVLMNSDSP